MKQRVKVFGERVERVGGTCGKKPQTLFWYNTNFKCCFGIFFQQKHEIML